MLDLFERICPRRYVQDIKRADVMDKFVGELQDAGLATGRFTTDSPA